MRHATDVDHVLAVATIVSRERLVRLAAWIGALWGIGHTLTIVAVGVPIVVFNWVVAPRLGLAMEFAVGTMLIVLGLRNLIGLRTPDVSRDGELGSIAGHPHPHADEESGWGWLDRTFGGLGIYNVLRPLVIGIVHGLAGSAAVALLVLTTIHDPRWAVMYLVVFGLGTVAGMVLITTAIAYPFARVGDRSHATRGYVRLATGLLSLAFGVFIAYRIGVADGLFSNMPQFTPQ